jgi:hypothetical protein
MQVVLWIGSVIGAAVVGAIVDRAILWRRPRFSPETASLARRSLATAAYVFAQSSAVGGRLHHPWSYNGAEIEQHVLDADLDAVRSRITNRRFAADVNEVRTELKRVYASSAKQRARFLVPGEPPSPREMQWEREDERLGAVQREHAERGSEVARRALQRLSRLERNV